MMFAHSLLLLASAASAAAPTLEPPPGWSAGENPGQVPGIVVVLRGPEGASFIVKRAPAAPLDNPAATRGYLNDVLEGLRRSTRRDYRSAGRVETKSYRNGVTAQLLRAQLGGEERLALGVFEAADGPYLSVLMSAAPDAMLPSLLGALSVGRGGGEVATSGAARSLDGQLEIALGGGLRSRALLDAERAKGFVLVIQGAGSEVLFQKLEDAEATKPAEQGAIARELAAAAAGVPADKASPVRAAPSAAGPVGVYSWADADARTRITAGYLPWGYWGYQLFARGPSSDELLVGALAALKAGPSAVPGLVSASPKIPLPGERGARRFLPLAAAAGAALLALLVWSLRRKNATLPS